MNRLDDYDYQLPSELIAQTGAEPRDHSRLMVLGRNTQSIAHHRFFELTEFLHEGDLLVLNQSKVIPARLMATNPQGTAVEVFLVREVGPNWEAMLRPAKRAKGLLQFSDGLKAEVVGAAEDGLRLLQFSENVWNHLDALGQTPLPPYIQSSVEAQRYQTVYAKTPGSVAAPTAGLHFTPQLLQSLSQKGIEQAFVTLHVGPGTFRPVKEDPDKHHMHQEPYEVPPETAQAVAKTRARGGRVVAVGTTVVRTLESAWANDRLQTGPGETRLFIRPGFTFRAVDALITNFHLPKSTLLMLVAAFAGHSLTMKAYETAVAERYRFYSLGDAMLIV